MCIYFSEKESSHNISVRPTFAHLNIGVSIGTIIYTFITSPSPSHPPNTKYMFVFVSHKLVLFSQIRIQHFPVKYYSGLNYLMPKTVFQRKTLHVRVRHIAKDYLRNCIKSCVCRQKISAFFNLPSLCQTFK